MMKRVLLSGFLACAVVSCVKDRPQAPIAQNVHVGTGSGRVLVVNEGNFFASNGAVSVFDPASGAVAEDAYKAANGASPGDVAQSICAVNGSLVVVVNNSGKLLFCDGALRKKGELALPSPRYMLAVTPAKAYVSDYNSGSIAVLDLAGGKVSSQIKCGGWTEQMRMVFHKVFVTNVLREYLYVVNSTNDQVEDSIFVGSGAGSLVTDRNGKLWVLGSGDEAKNVSGRLSRIDPLTNAVERALQFSPGTSPRTLCANAACDTLYFLSGGVYRFGITDAALPSSAFIQAGSRNFYGLGVSPRDGRIYVADALDYIQRSNVYYYDAGGKELGYFKAGINASGFYFE